MLTVVWLPAAGREVGEAGAGPRSTERDTGHWPPPAGRHEEPGHEDTTTLGPRTRAQAQ